MCFSFALKCGKRWKAATAPCFDCLMSATSRCARKIAQENECICKSLFHYFTFHPLFAMLLPKIIVLPADGGTVAQPSSPHSSVSSTSDVSASSDDTKKRASYSLKAKREIIAKVDSMLAKDSSANASNLMAQMGLPHFYYGRWKKDLKKAEDMAHSPDSKVTVNGEMRKLHPGRMGLLSPLADLLTNTIDVLRDKAIPVTTLRVTLAANKLSEKFKEKSRVAKAHIVRRFVSKVGYSHRAPTHVAQKLYKETEMQSKYFLDFAKVRIEHLPDGCVSNMDETPVPFYYGGTSTLEKKGTRTVHMHAVGEKMRATLFVAIDKSGEMMSPFLVFKGTPNGRIEKKELVTFSKDAFYCCQKNAWCDEKVMIHWIDTAFKAWVQMRRAQYPGVTPLLVMDAHTVHFLRSVVNRIENMGCDVLFIPAGCTYLCQPVDVGMNRPLKRELKLQWEAWMEEQGTDLTPPSREHIANWVIHSYHNITKETVQNAWKKKGFSWCG